MLHLSMHSLGRKRETKFKKLNMFYHKLYIQIITIIKCNFNNQMLILIIWNSNMLFLSNISIQFIKEKWQNISIMSRLSICFIQLINTKNSFLFQKHFLAVKKHLFHAFCRFYWNSGLGQLQTPSKQASSNTDLCAHVP